MSLREPLAMLEGADYKFFRRFDYTEEERPTYLKDTYGIDLLSDGPALNIGKLIREDLKFEDSAHNQGVQVADLLASGVRRCLRHQFRDNDRAAQLLGALMVQGKADQPPIRLLGLGKYGSNETSAPASPSVARVVKAMDNSSRAMLVPIHRTSPN